MRHDMSDLFGRREIFWELQDVAKHNPRILSPRAFFDWMCWNYVSAVSTGIRGFVDQHHESRSLWRMLYEILDNPGVLDRETHARMYARGPGIAFGRDCFNAASGGRAVISQASIRSDLRRLENASDRIRRFVNKRIAHRTNPGQIRRLPTFNEVDAALQAIDAILVKYNFLLTAQGYDTFEATRQFSWREVLLEPWIPQGSKLHPEAP